MSKYESLNENGKAFVDSSEKYSVDEDGFVVNSRGHTVPPEIIEAEVRGLTTPHEFCIYGYEVVERTAKPVSAKSNTNRVYVPKDWTRVMLVRLE